MMNSYILINGIILTPFEELKEKAIIIKDGKINKLISNLEYNNLENKYLENFEVVDAKRNYISPGFIDIHCHGANNSDAIKDDIKPMAEFKIQNGETAFLPTFWTAEFNSMVNATKKVNDYIEHENKVGSKVLGINSEGPYLNPKLGAQKKNLVREPSYDDYIKLIKTANNNLKIMTVAPELKNSNDLIRTLRKFDVVVSIGHTDINISRLPNILDMGITLITHIFNAMGNPVSVEKGVKPAGIAEELLIRDDLMCEVMCDKNGTHVSSTLLQILLRCKGVDNIILITDSMNMTGNKPGSYYLQDGRKAIIIEGDDVVRLEDGGLAGSIMTMNSAIKNMIEHTNVSLKDAIKMATYNPAKIINISNKKGAIKTGLDADLCIFNKDFDVFVTMVEGEIRYLSDKF